MSVAADAGPGSERRRALGWLALAGALLFAAGLLVGLDLAAPPPRPPSYLEQLSDLLELRPAQIAAIEAVLGEEDREIDGWLQDSLRELGATVAERRERTERELLACLDGAQRERYAELARDAGAGRR